ncbi:MAG: hypothetical protein QGH41_04860, partial [Roseibacillus sp.]|nr:hypothetical protein [Roseibacillus sp.]
MADGSCLAVDFTGASGSDVMLVTTTPAEGSTVNLSGTPLTFYFPTTRAPAISVEGNRRGGGRQRSGLAGG